MSLLNLLNQVQDGQGVAGLARQLGMEQGQATELTKLLAPAIGSAAKKRVERGQADAIVGQLSGEAQGAFFDDPAAAAAPDAQEQGQQFLERLLGSREATEELAAQAATRAGADQGQTAQFLPALAAMLQGGMQKQTPDDSISGLLQGLGGANQDGGGLMGLVGGLLGGSSKSGGGMDLGGLLGMLDADGDGSPLDDILERVMR